ncbi:uncharacterized protein LOC121526577 [Cheilinus undulatus]|uniref:uncharacterized protein LOC121526577 n=1 Tax=Cheilinus undulatus TaxID=241271 RepID=UPI001BD6DBBA|nr:uncharacterized protein LOC121526577 [Cheilinus undulatus]
MKMQREDQTCSLSDKMEHKESEGSLCINCNLDSPHGHLLKTAEDINYLKKRNPSDLHTSSQSSCQSGTMKREELEHPHELQKEKPDDKERSRSQQINKTKDLPLRDRSWDQTLAAGLDGWLGSSTDRKRQLESDSFVEVKRLKRESVEDSFDSSHVKSVHQMRELSALYPYSNRFSVRRTPSGNISYPGAELHPYQTIWDSKKADLYWRQNVLRDHSSNPCRVIRIPSVSQRHKDAFCGYSSTPLHFPLAVRQQETVYSRGREFLHPYQQKYSFYLSRSQLPHPGFLQTSHFEH